MGVLLDLGSFHFILNSVLLPSSICLLDEPIYRECISKTEYLYTLIVFHVFQFNTFLSVAFTESTSVNTLEISSSLYNCFFNAIYPFGLSVMVFVH